MTLVFNLSEWIISMDASIDGSSTTFESPVVFSQPCRAIIRAWLASRPHYAVFFDATDPHEEIASFSDLRDDSEFTYSVTADLGGRFTVWTKDAEELGSFGTIEGALAELGRWI